MRILCWQACPQGRFCEQGANESLPCTTDWLSPSAESSCPEGSVEDLGTAYGQLIILAIAAAVLVLLLEILGCLLKRWNRARAKSQTVRRNNKK